MTWLRSFLVVLFASAVVAACSGSGAPRAPFAVAAPLPPGMQARGIIKHVVVIVQENRTFDDIYGGFAGGPPPYPSADASIPAGIAAAMHFADFHVSAPNAGHDKYRCLQLHDFAQDAWLQMKTGPWLAGCPTAPPPLNPYAHFKSDPHALTYVPQTFRTIYWDIANKYELGDRYFAVNSTESFPGHQFIVSMQSMNDSGQEIANQPLPDTKAKCWLPTPAPNTIDTPVLGANGFINWQLEGAEGVCWNHETFADALNASGVTWTHYITDPSNGVFDGFINFRKYADQTRTWPRSITDLRPALRAGRLTQFTWVKPPCIWLSDHPGNNSRGGQQWVASVLNWIGENPALWPNTVIFVTWDDWGGFYDHVMPPPTRPDGLGPGLREPFLVISAYGTQGQVVHTVADYASVLKFAEELFQVSPVNAIDANATELNGFFNFTQTPQQFRSISGASGFSPERGCAGHAGTPPSEIDR
ncbi:MAG: hypothetical protein JO199_12775 [Candidatus Eremiobacteraeota bacterium]|nr:hypothetical protein [Candidatus Eremiobacteraeota bacterium]